MAKKIIFSVDDEKPITDVIKNVLQPEGYKVVTANSGEEALEKLKSLKPDLILLDMLMPGMSGTDLCQKLKADPKLKHLKVIFLTVIHATKAGQKQMKKLQVLDYITKPFDMKDLKKRIDSIIKSTSGK